MEIITVANQKGGTGKSTTAAAIAQGAAAKKKKALAIDLDPQANLSFIYGADSRRSGAYELMTGQAAAADLIQHTENGDIIAASSNLAAADTTFKGEDQRVYALRDNLAPIMRNYDIIVIDTPPTLSSLLYNALASSSKVIIPLQADSLSLQGLYQLQLTISDVQQRFNDILAIAGVLFTKHTTRTVLSRDLAETIEDKCRELKIPVFKTTIRAGVAAQEAQTMQQSLFTYAPRANVTEDYKKLLKELHI